MRIRRRLQLNVAVSVITAIVICMMLFLSLQRITTVSNLAKSAGDIMSGMLERVTLSNDYIRNGNIRAKKQWFAKHEQIDGFLKDAAEKFQAPEDRNNIAAMMETHQSIGRIFSAIVANKEKTESSGLERESEERLLNQLNMRVYEGTIRIHRLLESSRKARSSVLRQTGVEIGSLLAFLIAVAMFNAWSMGRALTERVGRLREGASLIGSGDLAHRIDIRGDDELAELSLEFNAMAGKLRDSYQGLEREVEERKRAEEAIKESEMRFRLLVEGVKDYAIFMLDPEGRVATWNEGAERLKGYKTEEIIGKHYSLFYRAEDITANKPDDELKAALKEGKVEEEGWRVRKDGSFFWAGVLITAVYDETGTFRGFAKVVRDITERKQAEERLKASLHEKEVMLKEIHHRVKNNLQVISSLIGLQADGTRDETVREVLRDVTYRVRAMALVHEKLYQTADLARIDFAEYAKSLLNYLWRAHGSAAAVVRLTFDLEPLSLPVDTAVPCGLILNELAGNALKHAFRGRSEGEVIVSLRSIPEGHISLCLRDNGVGLPAGLDWRQARSLGLRLVQMLAGQLNATVEVNRQDGTEFRINFSLPETAKNGEPSHE